MVVAALEALLQSAAAGVAGAEAEPTDFSPCSYRQTPNIKSILGWEAKAAPGGTTETGMQEPKEEPPVLETCYFLREEVEELLGRGRAPCQKADRAVGAEPTVAQVPRKEARRDRGLRSGAFTAGKEAELGALAVAVVALRANSALERLAVSQ